MTEGRSHNVPCLYCSTRSSASATEMHTVGHSWFHQLVLQFNSDSFRDSYRYIEGRDTPTRSRATSLYPSFRFPDPSLRLPRHRSLNPRLSRFQGRGIIEGGKGIRTTHQHRSQASLKLEDGCASRIERGTPGSGVHDTRSGEEKQGRNMVV